MDRLSEVDINEHYQRLNDQEDGYNPVENAYPTTVPQTVRISLLDYDPFLIPTPILKLGEKDI